MKIPPITERQQQIYDCWLANNQLYKPTARAMGTQPEKVRQAVAAVLCKLQQPPPEPKHCEYCGKELGCRNQSGYCAGCYEKSPQRRNRMFLNKAIDLANESYSAPSDKVPALMDAIMASREKSMAELATDSGYTIADDGECEFPAIFFHGEKQDILNVFNVHVKFNKNVRWWDFYDSEDKSGCRAAVCSLPEGYSGDLPTSLMSLLKEKNEITPEEK